MDQKKELEKWFANTADLKIEHVDELNGRIRLYYLSTMADQGYIRKELLPKLKRLDLSQVTIMDVEIVVGATVEQRVSRQGEVVGRLIDGDIFIHVEGEKYGISIPADASKERSITPPEIEANVLGPQIAFVESLATNISIIRKYLPTPQLIYENQQVGQIDKTDVAILYLDQIANEQNVQIARQRICDITVDRVIDAYTLAQLIEDNSYTIFPQLQITQRPDRVVAGLTDGQVVILVDGSPFAIAGPTNLMQFLQAAEDFYFRWSIATFLRVLRLIAIVLSLLLAPAYVATLTFHYEMIPVKMLIQLSQSRARVPFPPLMEALMLEGIIELLREAGARLPTKVGQTIGIVGGIVIGQAAVQAGFTSNILIIIVALGALSSFIAPSYVLGSAIRVIRFPMIFLAGIWGGIGIAVGFSFLISHLLLQTSFGRPFLEPVYPMRILDLKDSIIRLPLQWFSYRPVFLRTKDEMRFTPNEAFKKQDIDE
ncbi:spore germination protein [Brevibacillus sp. SYSU BS000544]|uniref:spore germination protein n=1 Tax=Brevibacillus sp. SYSU BS000544 TaxID=3416443 RepID=UPI003CE524D8